MSKKKDKKAKKQRKRLLIRAQSQYPDLSEYTLNPPTLPRGVVPQGQGMAMDSSPIGNFGADFFWGTGFIGYPKLAELAQIAEYRAVAETTAKEMTREWIELKSIGDDEDNSKQIQEIETHFEKLNVRQIFRQAIETEHLFGRAQILLKIKGHEGEKLKNPLVIDPRTIEQGSLKALVNIEPMWTSPAIANTHDPSEPDFYKPKQWYVMGKTVHNDRLFTLVSRPVPDMLKPSYNFGGVSMSQLMQPYVNRWLRTVNSVSDLVSSFSLSGIKTEMSDILSGGCDDVNLQARADLYNQYRDNRGLMLLDRESEEFFQFNTPLSTLDALLAQAQEQMAAPSHTPLVKLLGITPSGLNASSEGEIAVYYDWIKSLQENLLREPLTKLLKIVQLHLFGAINDNITFDFRPLAQMSELDKANIRKAECDIDVAYLQNGVVSDVEVRTKLAANAESGFNGIDVDDFASALGDEADDPLPAQDADGEWDESKHPRAENGQFGSGGTTEKQSENTLDTPKIPEIKGDELGTWSSMKDLRDKAKEYAKRFVGHKFVNAETGHEIEVSMSGVKHTISGAQDSLIKTIPAIPDIVKTAKFLHTEEPKKEDTNVLGVEKYYADVKIEGATHRMLVTVKHQTDGRRYYDHGFYVGKV